MHTLYVVIKNEATRALKKQEKEINKGTIY